MKVTTDTRSSAIAEGPRDALFYLKSCQLLHNCTKKNIRKSLQQVNDIEGDSTSLGHISLSILVVCSNGVSILHCFRDVNSFTVCDCLWPSEILQLQKKTIKIIGYVYVSDSHVYVVVLYLRAVTVRLRKASNSESDLEDHLHEPLKFWLARRTMSLEMLKAESSNLHTYQVLLTDDKSPLYGAWSGSHDSLFKILAPQSYL